MKIVFPLVVIVCAVVVSGCMPGSDNSTSAPSQTEQSAPAANEKSGDTSKTGTISTSEGRYFLQESGGTPEEIESYAVELEEYVGQTVTVTGQYSGDTLFVGSVQ